MQKKRSKYERPTRYYGERTMLNADYYLFWRFEYIARNPEFQKCHEEVKAARRSIRPLLNGIARRSASLSFLVKMETGFQVEGYDLGSLMEMAEVLKEKIQKRTRKYETPTEFWLKKILELEIFSMRRFGLLCRRFPNNNSSRKLAKIMMQEKSLDRLQEGLSCHSCPATATKAVSVDSENITIEIPIDAPMDVILSEIREQVEKRRRKERIFPGTYRELNQEVDSIDCSPNFSASWSRLIKYMPTIQISKNLDDAPRLAGIYLWDKVNNDGMKRSEAINLFRESYNFYPQGCTDSNIHRIYRQTCKCIENYEVLRVS